MVLRQRQESIYHSMHTIWVVHRQSRQCALRNEVCGLVCSDRSAIVVHKPVFHLRSAGQAVYGSFAFGTLCTRPQPQDVRCLQSTGWRHQHKLDSARCGHTRLPKYRSPKRCSLPAQGRSWRHAFHQTDCVGWASNGSS